MFAKNDKILFSSVLILTILFVLSFSKSCTNTDKREVIKTALVNPKYTDEISEIIIQHEDEKLSLIKKNDIWFTQNAIADSKKVENLLQDLIKVRKLYKISYTNNKKEAFFSDSSSFTISYSFPGGVHSLYFGSQDFSQTSRYLQTDKNTQIYEIDTTFDKYLSINPQNWSEPFIISQIILGKITTQDIQSTKVYFENKVSEISDIQKLLELRHAGFPDFEVLFPQEKSLTLDLELGNKSQINVEIFSTNSESEYLLCSKYTSSKQEKYTFWVKISEWTYNKIKEITL